MTTESRRADFDVMEHMGGSLIQHGDYNRRIYLMKLDPADLPGLVEELAALARRRGYTKIFVKVPASSREPFLAAEYGQEAVVPGFFGGKEDAAFLGFYLDEARRRERHPGKVQENLELALARQNQGRGPSALPAGFRLAECSEDDVAEMAAVYRAVFPTYPFPIHDPDYLRQTMRTHIRYFQVRQRGRLVALSSAETDRPEGNAEMTDFATLPDSRGHGLAVHLLHRMQQEMAAEGIPTLYTIARSLSAGMNITFAKLGYAYGGTLINNTNISGRTESMNVWYRRLAVE
jgi:putative beta-lysine N-acetyltransferase